MHIAERFRNCPLWALLTVLLLVPGPTGATTFALTGRANPFKPLIRTRTVILQGGAGFSQKFAMPSLPPLIKQEEPSPEIEEVPKLAGVISGPSGAIAAIKIGTHPIVFLKSQETLGGLTMLALSSERATLRFHGKTYRLNLASQEK